MQVVTPTMLQAQNVPSVPSTCAMRAQALRALWTGRDVHAEYALMGTDGVRVPVHRDVMRAHSDV